MRRLDGASEAASEARGLVFRAAGAAAKVWRFLVFRFSRSLANFVLCVALAGCGGVYGDLVARGDKFAEAGQWDEAAAAYEEAVRHDPQEEEARIKLKDVRRRQASERLNRAEALEKRGELTSALALVQEAVRFDASNTRAQTALTRITDAVLDQAEKLMSDDKLRQAFELTTLVLKGSKHHPRARELDDRVRTRLAEQSFQRARAFMDKDKLGNALVELAACITYRPDYPDAKLHFGQVKLKLEEQLRFTVALERFGGTGPNANLTTALSPELLQQSLDERLLLKVLAGAPPKEQAVNGVLVRGEFLDYGYDHSKKSISRSCDYQCGTDHKPNPEIQRMREQIASAEQMLSMADDEIGRKERDVLDADKEVARHESETQKRQAELDDARNRLSECQKNAKPDESFPCSSEESNVRSKQSSLDSARSQLESARARAGSIKDDISNAKSRQQSARQNRDRLNQELLRTPEQIEVPKVCPHNYAVEQHAVLAKVTVKLSIDQLTQDKSVVRDQPFNYDARAADETFPAQAGRCNEIANGNPLQLPSEKDLRKNLMTKVVKDLRGKVLASYDAYRRSFLAAARRHESGGLTEEAIESYVRYVLTGPHALQDKKKLAEFFNRTRGIGTLDALWKL
jgi:tetratricopeptide (TPR) repeat protein